MHKSDHKKAVSAITKTLKAASKGNYSLHVPLIQDDTIFTPVIDALNQFLEHIDRTSQECKRVEKTLKESEERFRSLYENSALGIYRTTPEGVILMVNPAAVRMLGYNTFEELKERNLEMTGFEPSYPRKEFRERMEKDGLIIGLESAWIRKDGTTIYVRENARAIRNAAGKIIYYDGTFEEITEKKKEENRIENDLKEKILLLKEVHHRVKNNLQIICSLLNLQSYQIHDQQAKDAFQYSKNRIYSMALVHEQLYRSDDFSHIQMNSYIDTLIRELDKAYHISSRVKISKSIEHIELSIDYAIPCGLILNELLTNAIKHAFPDEQHGKIQITFKKIDDQRYEICIQDNGVGLPESMDIESSQSLGLHMVKVLIQQIGGELTVTKRPGATFRIRF